MVEKQQKPVVEHKELSDERGWISVFAFWIERLGAFTVSAACRTFEYAGRHGELVP